MMKVNHVESARFGNRRYWLDDETKVVGQFWKRKNAWRNGLKIESQTDDPVVT